MISQARIVVVGGDMMGVGLLQHLPEEGWKDSLLIEEGELTSAFAYLEPEFAEVGTGIEAEVLEDRRRATVVECESASDPKNERLRG